MADPVFPDISPPSTIPWEAYAPQFASSAALEAHVRTLPKEHLVRRAFSAVYAAVGPSGDVACVFRELIRRGIRFEETV